MTGNSGAEAFGRRAGQGTGLPLGSDEWKVLNVVAEYGEIRGTGRVGDLAFGSANGSREERIMRASKALTGLRDYRLLEWSEDDGCAITWKLAQGVHMTNLALMFERARSGQA
ncbi:MULTISPECIES: hypothetical protein [Burkholderia]|jgi:hypothetical protein|uniref:hypothetical protein n=1 Tax=Burkholderia TaxID=32008 RepID=UPI0006187218|nr:MULTISPECIES: hypothetical protein [Burkholderia]MBS6358811.1 hypothetical protein [Burkholderia sp.]MDS0803538.1 hypothetical protein [Burkholderia cenocepacia]GLZ74511.1 hypothetical protein Bcon01_75560 [Burkholderia contaminans]